MRVLFIALLCIASIAWAQSPDRGQLTGEGKKAVTEERGTEKAPLFLKGEVTTEKSEAEAASDAEERKEKRAVDETLVRYTGLSALFAFLIFVAACFQMGLFWYNFA
jgi:hypothetical protein